MPRSRTVTCSRACPPGPPSRLQSGLPSGATALTSTQASPVPACPRVPAAPGRAQRPGSHQHRADRQGQVGGAVQRIDVDLDAQDQMPDHVARPGHKSLSIDFETQTAPQHVKNLILAMNGEKPIAQVNPEVPVKKVV